MRKVTRFFQALDDGDVALCAISGLFVVLFFALIAAREFYCAFNWCLS